MRHQRAELPLTIDGLDAARDFFAGCIADSNPAREHLFVAHLDEQSRCVHLSRHAGDETGGRLPAARDRVRRGNSWQRGDRARPQSPQRRCAPSESDKRATRRLATAAEALDCTVIDHLVFGGQRVHQLQAARLPLTSTLLRGSNLAALDIAWIGAIARDPISAQVGIAALQRCRADSGSAQPRETRNPPAGAGCHGFSPGGPNRPARSRRRPSPLRAGARGTRRARSPRDTCGRGRCGRTNRRAASGPWASRA